MHRPSRSGIEIGYVITVSLMLLTLAFNAGIQYARVNSLENTQTALSQQVQSITAAQTPVQVRLGRIETILGEIQQQQAALQATLDGKHRTAE